MSCCLSLVLRSFCFVSFFFLLSLKPRPFVQSFFVLRHACVLFRFCFFVSLEMSLFPSIFCTITVFSLYGEYGVRFFLPDGVFIPCDHGLDFCENSINQSIDVRLRCHLCFCL